MNPTTKAKLTKWKQENNWQLIARHLDDLVQPEAAGWNDPDLLAEAGFAHSQLGHFDRALALYQRWHELLPQKAQPPYCIGYVYAQKKDFHTAIDWYDRALERYPEYLVCLYRKGVALLHLAKSQQAHETLTTALQVYRKHQRDPEYARRFNKRYIQILFNLAKALYGMRKFEQALKQFQQVLQEDSRSHVKPLFKYFNLAKCHFALGDGEQAKRALEKVVELDSRKDYVWELFARVHHYLLQDSQQALHCLERALHCRWAPYLLVTRARIYKDLGDYAKAIPDLHQALKRDRLGKHKILWELAHIAFLSGQFSQAISYLQRAIDFKQKMYEADYAEAHYLLHQIYDQIGEPEKAERELDTALTIQPSLVWRESFLMKSLALDDEALIQEGEPEE